jgi:hypothetical protein
MYHRYTGFLHALDAASSRYDTDSCFIEEMFEILAVLGEIAT